MCGIAGHYKAQLKSAQLDLLNASLQHRGPDGHGKFEDQNTGVGLVHCRLSIIDISEAASQPFVFENLVLVFNGELYNYKEVRKELRTLGYSFTTESDTEVLIKAFHQWREKSIDKFIGIFAFALYDKQEDEIFLFRDRMGVKPLYYHLDGKRLIFASELKAFHNLGLSKEIEMASVVSYFRFGFIPAEHSIFKQIKKLKKGHYLHASNRGTSISQYWNAEISDSKSERSEKDWEEDLHELLISSFKYRMVSDVPVGVFLSGGIDSSLVAAILQKHVGNINTLTIGFDEPRFNESQYARKVAQQLGTHHHEEILTLQEAKNHLSLFYEIYDEPFSDSSGIPVSMISEMARARGIKVVLSADGGDELFGGYSQYFTLPDRYKKFNSTSGKALSALTHMASSFQSFSKGIYSYNFEHRIAAVREITGSKSYQDFYESNIANISVEEARNLLNITDSESQFYRMNKSSLHETMMAWDLHYYLTDDLLVKVDRATMYHGVEGREPFMDHRLVKFAAQLPLSLKLKNGQGKYMLRKILKHYFSEEFFNRPKQGFSIPIYDWFASDLSSLFDQYLDPVKIRQAGIFHEAEVAHELKKYYYYKKRNKEYNIEKMWRLVSFMMWWEKWMK
jgi:asparagine synthase (glutamine-hydrolysing)